MILPLLSRSTPTAGNAYFSPVWLRLMRTGLLSALLLLAGVLLPRVAAAQTAPPDGTGDDIAVFLPLVMFTRAAPPEPVELIDFTYRLQEGDDLSLLAIEWGVDSELTACVTSTGLQDLNTLRPGDIIMIANARFRCHTVTEGETLAQIAETYQVPMATILDQSWNVLSSASEPLQAGRRLLILDGVRPDVAALRASQTLTSTAPVFNFPTPTPAPTAAPGPWPYGDGHFIWPVQGAVISQGFSNRHRALDLAVPLGTPVVAADNGVVLKAGYSKDGYGGRIIIDHQIDYVTLYAHLSQAVVEPGDIVTKGQIIGYVGSTGNSTGPHLHFELRDFGYLINSLPLLNEE